MWNTRLDESQAGIKTAGKNTSNFRCADNTTLIAESKEVLRSILMRKKEESEKPGLKLNVLKPKTMASGPITTEGGKVEAVTDFTFLDSKITVDGYSSHEIKRHLLPER